MTAKPLFNNSMPYVSEDGECSWGGTEVDRKRLSGIKGGEIKSDLKIDFVVPPLT